MSSPVSRCAPRPPSGWRRRINRKVHESACTKYAPRQSWCVSKPAPKGIYTYACIYMFGVCVCVLYIPIHTYMYIYLYKFMYATARMYSLCTYAFTLRPDLSFIYFAVRGALRNKDRSWRCSASARASDKQENVFPFFAVAIKAKTSMSQQYSRHFLFGTRARHAGRNRGLSFRVVRKKKDKEGKLEEGEGIFRSRVITTL